MKPTLRRRARVLLPAIIMCAAVAGASPVFAQSVSVTAADPASGTQDTTALVVKITGKNFAPGAQSQFFLSGTTNPDGIVVRGTTFVSSTEVSALIDIAPTASLASFDIRVTNTSGRSGKGSDLFHVVAKVNACTVQPSPGVIGLVQAFNPGALYEGIGPSSLLGRATVSASGGPANTVLLAALGTNSAYSKVEVFALDAISGALLDGQPLCVGCAPQPHVTLHVPNTPDGTPGGAKFTALGNINGDTVPDFVVAEANAANVFLSSVSGTGVVAWTAIPVPRPASVSNFGWDVALGDIDLDGRDELAVSQIGSSQGKGTPGAIHVYDYVGGGMTLVDTITQSSVTPALKNGDVFGYSVVLADVTGDARADLIASAPWRPVTNGTGAVLVFQTGPSGISRSGMLLVPQASSGVSHFGRHLSTAAIDGSADGRPDVLAFADGTGGGQVFRSPVYNGQIGTLPFAPAAGLETGWATMQASVGDVNGDGRADVLVGAPNATVDNPTCPIVGVSYLFLGTADVAGGPTIGWTRVSVTPPTADGGNFGWSGAVVNGAPFFVVGVRGGPIGGQAYLYRVLP
jgi:hypothetical protein